jgi:hypothetical protein
MDPFGEIGPPEERCILAVDLRTAPGSSGSPVFDVDGVVIGLVNATRSSPGHSFHFAQRVDLLAELLDGKVTERIDARAVRWRERRDQWASTEAFAAFLLLKGGERLVQEVRAMGGEPTGLTVHPIVNGTLRVSPSAPATPSLPEEAGAAGFYAAIAISADFSNIDLHVKAGESIFTDSEPDGHPALILPHRGGERITLEVLGGPPEGTDVQYWVARYELGS